MSIRLQQLLPSPSADIPLNGLYLEQAIDRLGSAEKPFVYANFLASLDGRIALIDDHSEDAYLPKILTNANDFRLFLELHAQADCLITHGAYLRSMMKGTLGNILQSGTTSETRDLAAWRKSRGLEKQPAIVVASASLDFEIPPSVKQHNQPCYIATGRLADREKIRFWEKSGYPVIIAGQERMVEATPLVAALSKLGYRRLYLIAGPWMLDCMLRERQLSRLYQTISLQLLGGESFHSLLPGPPLGRSGELQMEHLYFDPGSNNHSSQLFTRFGVVQS